MSEGTLSQYSSTISSSGVAASSSNSNSTTPILVVTDTSGRSSGGNAANNRLPPLPSSRYCHTRWYDLRQNDVKGDMLRAPRIREGPHKGDRQYQNPPDDSEPHPGSNGGRFSKRVNFKNEMENWENTTCANLSFQDLGDDFQQENFLRTLRRLYRCERLQLIDNSLTDLSSVSLPRCTHLYLQGNSLQSFKQLPRAPALKHLTLTNNGIQSLTGLSVLRKTPIDSLVLSGNPVTFQENYRQRIFKALPSLKRLDGTPRLARDVSEEHEPKSVTCVIS